MTLFIEYLEKRLKEELPGRNSHLKMAPKIMERSFRSFEPNENAKKSAVLVPISLGKDPQIMFTLRSHLLRSHKGQISFPGGRIETGESPLEAALRETYEEVGILPENIRIVGALSTLYVPPSNNLIYPFIGLLLDEPKVIINESEVDECFFVKMSHFIDPGTFLQSRQKLEGYEVDMPYWDVMPKAKLWGATSMILRELIDLYEEWVTVI